MGNAEGTCRKGDTHAYASGGQGNPGSMRDKRVHGKANPVLAGRTMHGMWLLGTQEGKPAGITAGSRFYRAWLWASIDGCSVGPMA